jgi:hypothetical protein
VTQGTSVARASAAAAPGAAAHFNFGDIAIVPPRPRVGPAGGELDAGLTSHIRAQQGGSALDPATRGRMEAAFAHNFADVRVHRGAEADALNHQLGANAFTVGRDIFLAQEATRAGTYGGDETLAHELTHVVQQRGAQRDGALTVTAVDDPHEREASIVAGHVSAGHAPAHVPAAQGGQSRVATIRVQRDGKQPAGGAKTATPQPTLASLSKQVDALKKQQQATQLDLEWRAKFGQKMASYKQAVWRITGGIDAANKGFQDAQVAQSQTDQMWTQFFGLVVSVAFAGGFEFLAAKGLGAVGVSAATITKRVEQLENPLNALVGGFVTNVRPTYLQAERAEKGQTPAVSGGGGGALAFLAAQSEALEMHAGNIEGAFAARAQQLKALTDEQWATFDVSAQAATYETLYKALESAGKGVEDLRTPEQVAAIIELHLWATWIKGEHSLMITMAGMIEDTNPEDAERENPNALANFGSDINARLIALGVESAVGTGLYTHWWERNADNWNVKIMNWAKTYNRSVAVN